MNRLLLSCSAIALTLGVAACGPKAEQAADSAVNTAGNAMADVGNAASNVANDASNALSPTPGAQEFVNTAAKSDAFEIAAAKLAKTNAASAAVKDFAAMMIDAHTASTAKIKAASKAAEPAITPDPALTEDQNEDLASLGKLKGADFDKAYIDGQVDAHEDALELMQGYAKDGTVPGLKSAAGEIAPVVQKHLTEAKGLKAKM